jgi:putative endonuclease
MVITEKRRLGNIGENVAAEYLRRHGHEVTDRNYLRKWGELDIVTKKGSAIHFVEVKSVSRRETDWQVTHGTSTYRPEENVHPQKLKRLSRVIQTYLLDKHLDTDWQLDIAIVFVDEVTRKARVEILENVVI